LKEYGKFQIQAFFIQILFFTADDSSADGFGLWSTITIV